MTASLLTNTTFVAYLIAMVVIAGLAWRRTHNLADYLLGGRQLGPGTSALSAGASDMSGWLLLGLPGYAYVAGLEAIWIAVGLLVGTWLNWLLVAPRLRRLSFQANDSLTIPAYLDNRFGGQQRGLRTVSAGFILLFFLFYTTAGLVAGGKLFATVFGMDYGTAVLIGAVVVVSYTFIGGFLAVSWTDVLQGLMMFAALLLLPVMVWLSLSSGHGVSPTAFDPHVLNPFNTIDGQPLGVIAVLSLLGWGLGYFGQPHILARFQAIRSVEAIPLARRLAVGWTGLSLAGSVAVGVLAIAWFATPLDDSERVFMLLVEALFHPLIAGVLLAAILAAIMSTADSQLLVSASALSEDLFHPLRPNADARQLMWVGRLAVVGIAVLATRLAMNEDSQVLGLVAYAWAGFGAAFGPVLVLSLFWSGISARGAMAGMVVGGLTVVIWPQFSGGPGELFELYEIIPGVILATLATVLVSRHQPPSNALRRWLAEQL